MRLVLPVYRFPSSYGLSIKNNIFFLLFTNMESYYNSIFPNGNRNVGGPQYFHYIHTHGLSPDLHKRYCAVSGSPIDGQHSMEVKLPTVDGGKHVCGDFYLCCWPCACDLMRFAKAETYMNQTVLTIPDPCNNPKAFKKIKAVTSYQCINNQTQNGMHAPSGRLITGVLHRPRPCTTNVQNTLKRCAERNDTPVSQLTGGMGDIFARVASLG